MTYKTVTAGDLQVGDEVVEQRDIRGLGTTDVYLTVLYVDKGRYVNYRLNDGSWRILSPYIEVDVTGRKGLMA